MEGQRTLHSYAIHLNEWLAFRRNRSSSMALLGYRWIQLISLLLHRLSGAFHSWWETWDHFCPYFLYGPQNFSSSSSDGRRPASFVTLCQRRKNRRQYFWSWKFCACVFRKLLGRWSFSKDKHMRWYQACRVGSLVEEKSSLGTFWRLPCWWGQQSIGRIHSSHKHYWH